MEDDIFCLSAIGAQTKIPPTIVADNRSAVI